MYNLPEINPKAKNEILNIVKNRAMWLGILLVIAFITLGFYSGAFSLSYIQDQIKLADEVKIEQQQPVYISDIAYDQAIIDAVKSATNSVVSIIISKNLRKRTVQKVGTNSDK